jgi:hypothetical protein
VNLPWWVWLLAALYCLPGVYGTFALMLQKPLPGLDENGEPYKSPPMIRRLIALPMVLVLLAIIWPYVMWSEYRHRCE